MLQGISLILKLFFKLHKLISLMCAIKLSLIMILWLLWSWSISYLCLIGRSTSITIQLHCNFNHCYSSTFYLQDKQKRFDCWIWTFNHQMLCFAIAGRQLIHIQSQRHQILDSLEIVLLPYIHHYMILVLKVTLMMIQRLDCYLNVKNFIAKRIYEEFQEKYRHGQERVHYMNNLEKFPSATDVVLRRLYSMVTS